MGDGIARHTPTLTGKKLIRALVVDSALMSHVSELITQLVDEDEWLEVGDNVSDIVNACWLAVNTWYGDIMIGSVSIFLGQMPDGWLALDGSTYDQVDYPELYAVLDGVFKNEIAETFTLPDIRDRFTLGASVGNALGDTGGSDTVTLTVDELPSHNHTYTPPVLNIDLEGPGVPDVLAAGVGTPTNTGSTGSGNAHDNVPPFLAVEYGIFTGRV